MGKTYTFKKIGSNIVFNRRNQPLLPMEKIVDETGKEKVISKNGVYDAKIAGEAGKRKVIFENGQFTKIIIDNQEIDVMYDGLPIQEERDEYETKYNFEKTYQTDTNNKIFVFLNLEPLPEEDGKYKAVVKDGNKYYTTSATFKNGKFTKIIFDNETFNVHTEKSGHLFELEDISSLPPPPKIIKLFVPKGPYGDLSNNSSHFPFVIDDKMWKTVTHYIYANLMSTENQRNIIRNVKDVKDVKDVFRSEQERNTTEIIQTSLNKGYDVKFLPILKNSDNYVLDDNGKNVYETVLDTSLIDELLSTGNDKIIYVTRNKDLGIGDDNTGKNLVGKTLMQLRQKLRTDFKVGKRQQETQFIEDNIYKAHLAYLTLLEEFEHGSDLSRFSNLSFDQIRANSKLSISIDKENIISKFRELQEQLKKQKIPTDRNIKRGTNIIPGGWQKLQIRGETYFRNLATGKMQTDFPTKRVTSIIPNWEKLLMGETYFRNLVTGKIQTNFPGKMDDWEKFQIMDGWEIKKNTDDRGLIYLTFKKPDTESTTLFPKEIIAAKIDETNSDKSEKVFEIPVEYEPYQQSEFMKLLYSSINNPNILTQYIRKTRLRFKKMNIEHSQKNIAFNIYVDNILKRNYPSLKENQYFEATQQQISTKLRNVFSSKLITLYKNNKLPKNLEDEIREKLDSMYVPSDEEIRQAESIPIDYQDIPILDKNEMDQSQPSNKEFRFDSNHKFSPRTYTHMLLIDNMSFPTVEHYMFYKLITRLLPEVAGDKTRFSSPYSVVLLKNENPDLPTSFINLDSLNQLYSEESTNLIRKEKQKNAEIALNEKFRNRHLQDLLAHTQNSTIEWDDDDPLGIKIKGRGGGFNFVGKYLMWLRSIFIENNKKEQLTIVSESDISTLLGTDAFMMSWFKMRAFDMCKVVLIMKNYLLEKDNLRINISANFVQKVLDEVYQSCSHLVGMTNSVKIPAPEYFKNIIKEYLGNEDIDVVEIFWKRLVVMIYYLMKYMKEKSVYNIKSTLATIETFVSRPNKKCVSIVDNEINCIVSAIINVLHGILKFNIHFSNNVKLSTRDVDTAAFIIMTEDINVVEKIKPNIVYKNDDIEENDDEEGVDEEIQAFEENEDEDEDENIMEENTFDIDNGMDFSKVSEFLLDIIEEDENTRNTIAQYILVVAQTIKHSNRIDQKIKTNRINFFSTSLSR